jgi:hypothetical protein
VPPLRAKTALGGVLEPSSSVRALRPLCAGGMLRCEECGKETTSEVEAHGWRAYLTVADEGEPEEVVVLCTDCAKREFEEDDDLRNDRPRR